MMGDFWQPLLTIAGLIGVGTFIEWYRRGRSINRLQAFFHWKFQEPMDIVLTTSSLSAAAQGPSSQDRINAQLGYVQATTEFSRVIGESAVRKEVAVHVSDGIGREPRGDLVILGGTGGNHLADRFLRYLQANWDVDCEYDEADEAKNFISLNGSTYLYDWTSLAGSNGDFFDYALVVLWYNPFAVEKRRAIYCAGFTAAGTNAAARYTVDELPRRYSSLCRGSSSEPVHLRAPGRRGRAWPTIAMVLSIEFRNDIPIDITELDVEFLPTPPFPIPGFPHGDI